MSRQLPETFLTRMQTQLQQEYESFLACYESEGFVGLRINTAKISVKDFLKITPFHLKPIPWTTNGFYYDKEEAVTRHPHYFAGLYYIQEPSAMLPASRLPITPGDHVLDLCAAPGGKTTELASRLRGTGILVANDVSPSRAKALVKNLALWGCPNVYITGETPEHLLTAFGSCSFDKILVDAPCSGEGMFRKDAGLIDSWIERGPEEYSDIQKSILDCAAQMLKPGGSLVYSTCTFSEAEDEAVIEWILKQYPDLSLEQPETVEGFANGIPPYEKCIRLWPHKIDGEGHFLALLSKKNDSDFLGLHPVKKAGTMTRMPDAVSAFMSDLPCNILENQYYSQIDDQCFLLPEKEIPRKLRYLRTGLLLGTLKKDRFEPSQALAMVLKAQDYKNSINLCSSDPRVFRYLKGETIELDDSEMKPLQKGWVLICTDGYALGWGKYASGTIKNKYYPGWRLQ